MAAPVDLSSVDFVAVDVETANADLASICQIGIATVRSGEVWDVWSRLVDPEDFFDGMNVSIHGITEDHVVGAPTFRELFAEVDSLLSGVVVSHTMFDHRALLRAARRHDFGFDKPQWLDSTRVVRRAWPDRYAHRGYGLKQVATDLGIAFRHHDAAEDARVAAEIVLRALAAHPPGLEEWLARVDRQVSPSPGPVSPSPEPVSPSPGLASPSPGLASPSSGPASPSSGQSSLRRDGNPEGIMSGEVLVFTGTLSVPRRKAADMAAAAGCEVAASVTDRTTILVVGGRDARLLADRAKSGKHRKAERRIRDGQPIQILRESDFLDMVSSGDTP